MKLARRPVLSFAAASAAVTSVCVASVVSATSSGAAATPMLHVARTVSSGVYTTPLQFTEFQGHTYVNDRYTTGIYRVGRTKPLDRAKPDPTRPGPSNWGVALQPGSGRLAFVFHGEEGGVLENPGGGYGLQPYNRIHRPDKQSYGLADPASHTCAATALRTKHIPVTYHTDEYASAAPYATQYLTPHQVLVSDGGAHDLLVANTRTFKLRTVAVLPRQALTLTAAFAKQLELPSCVVGQRYYEASVPTDIELGPSHSVYISARPGGVEREGTTFTQLPGVRHRGRIFRLFRPIDGQHKRLKRIGAGFVDPTGIAVTKSGGVLVAQPYIGRISADVGGRPSLRMNLPGVVSLEVINGHYWAGTESTPNINTDGTPRLVVLSH